MFLRINGKEDLLYELSQARKDFIIHYRCSCCDDEQVTHEFNTFDADELITKVEMYNYILIGLPCTNCGSRTRMLDIEDIIGIEIIKID